MFYKIKKRPLFKKNISVRNYLAIQAIKGLLPFSPSGKKGLKKTINEGFYIADLMIKEGLK